MKKELIKSIIKSINDKQIVIYTDIKTIENVKAKEYKGFSPVLLDTQNVLMLYENDKDVAKGKIYFIDIANIMSIEAMFKENASLFQ